MSRRVEAAHDRRLDGSGNRRRTHFLRRSTQRRGLERKDITTPDLHQQYKGADQHNTYSAPIISIRAVDMAITALLQGADRYRDRDLKSVSPMTTQ